MHLAVHGAFDEFAGAVAGQHAPPEGDGARMAGILDDMPFAGEAIEDQGGGVATGADGAA